MKVQTNCKGCQFSKTSHSEDGHILQVGCELDRVEALNPDGSLVGDEDGSYYEFNRFCNTYRPAEWLDVISEEEKSDIVGTVMQEVAPRMGFFVFLDTDATNAIEELSKTIQSIKNQSFHRASYVVVIFDKVEYANEIQELLANTFDFNETEYHMLRSIFDKEKNLLIDEAFKHAKNGWIYNISSGLEVPVDLIERVHKRVNIDMKRLVVVRPFDGVNGLLFQSSLFKFLAGNTPVLEPDIETNTSPNSNPRQSINLNTETFIERIEGFPREDEDTLISWEDFISA